jgi:hypothetical protein
LAARDNAEDSRTKAIAAARALSYHSLAGTFAGKGEGSEMSDAIGTFMPEQRTGFAAAGVRRQPLGHAGAASLAGARSSRSMQAHDPGGGGPGR